MEMQSSTVYNYTYIIRRTVIRIRNRRTSSTGYSHNSTYIHISTPTDYHKFTISPEDHPNVELTVSESCPTTTSRSIQCSPENDSISTQATVTLSPSLTVNSSYLFFVLVLYTLFLFLITVRHPIYFCSCSFFFFIYFTNTGAIKST